MIKEKMRSLRNSDNLAVSLPSHMLNGEKVLYVEDAPYELAHKLTRWLRLRPHAASVRSRPLDLKDRPTYDELKTWLAEMDLYERSDRSPRYDDKDRMAVLWKTWEEFLDWMEQTLDASLSRQEAAQERPESEDDWRELRNAVKNILDGPDLDIDRIIKSAIDNQWALSDEVRDAYPIIDQRGLADKISEAVRRVIEDAARGPSS